MSSGVGRVGDLEIAQDHDFQWLNWRLQRYLWMGMVAVLGLGLLGLFGSGPLSRTTAGSLEGPLHLTYPRFAEYRSSNTLEIQLGPSRGAQGEVRLMINQAYLDGVQIERIEPEPERVLAGSDGLTFVLLREQMSEPTQVRIDFKPEQRGLLRGRIALEDGSSLEFLQLIYP